MVDAGDGQRFLADGLCRLAAAGRPFRPERPGVILVMLDPSGGLLSAEGIGRAAEIGAAGQEALRSAVGDRAVVLPGPLERAPVVLFDTAHQSADDLVATVLDHLARPLRLGDQAHFIQSRIGLATSAAIGTTDLDELVHAAFGAAHLAVETGVHLCEASRSLAAEIRREAELRTAMARAVRADFEMHYQPIVDLESTRPLGYESLLRWRREGALLTPPSFLAAAEETSLLLPIGRAGTRVALEQLARWSGDGLDEPLFMSVNYSARQLADSLLLPIVEEALDELGLAPSQLWVEVTERDLVNSGSAAARTIEALAELGCVICVDDLGTGFAALRYLADLPVRVAKVDRSLVEAATTDRSIRSIVAAVCDISRSLGIATVAEGVERDAQVPLVRDLGFTHAQGYLYGRPTRAEELTPS